MALPPTIYRVAIELADIDRQRYASLQATVARHPSETAERLVARLLAWCLWYEEELTFTRGVGAGDEPDLWQKGADDRVRLWLEVGLPEADRLLKAARHSERVGLLAFGSTARHLWEKKHLPRLTETANLSVYGLEWSLLQTLGERLQRSIAWEVTISGGSLYLSAGGDSLEAPLTLLAGAPR